MFPVMGFVAFMEDYDVCAHDGQPSNFWIACLHLYLMPVYAVCVTCGDGSFVILLAIYSLHLLRELHNDMVNVGTGEGALCEAMKDTLLWYWAYIVLFISYSFAYILAAFFLYQTVLMCIVCAYIMPAIYACCSCVWAFLSPSANNERDSLLARAAGAEGRRGYHAIV